MNLANKLTLFRIILVPILVIVPYLNIGGELFGIPLEYIILDLIFIIASITDKLDGSIARKRNEITTFGKFLDPIADKLIVISALVLLVEYGKIPGWIPIIVLVREFLVSGYRLIAVEKNGEVIAANFWGKLKTVTQMVAIAIMLIDKYNYFDFVSVNMSIFDLIINSLGSILITMSVIATIFSGWQYLKNGKSILLEDM